MLEDVHVIHNMHWRSRSPDLRRNGTRSALDLTFHRVFTVLYVILYLIAFFVVFCCAFCCHSVRYISELVPRNIDSSFDDSYEASPPPPSEPLPGPQPNETWLLTVVKTCHAPCPSYFFTIAFIGKNHAVAALLTLCFAHFRESKALALCVKWQASGKPRSMGPCRKVFTTMALGGVR